MASGLAGRDGRAEKGSHEPPPPSQSQSQSQSRNIHEEKVHRRGRAYFPSHDEATDSPMREDVQPMNIRHGSMKKDHETSLWSFMPHLADLTGGACGMRILLRCAEAELGFSRGSFGGRVRWDGGMSDFDDDLPVVRAHDVPEIGNGQIELPKIRHDDTEANYRPRGGIGARPRGRGQGRGRVTADPS